jgi:UDP-N-acetylmuramate--alanine ligase
MSSNSKNSILDYQHFYLVGIKGVAMTSIAQCLIDANKTVCGSDLDEDFVTANILAEKNICVENFNSDFLDEKSNKNIDCLIYTAAHQGIDNPQVQAAIQAEIPVYSQAEALADLFNQKKGIAVCGVGGKSSTSAMLVWVLEKLNIPISFSVGVGEIIGLKATGSWKSRAEYFIAEADEYAVDVNALKKGEEMTPRFSFLQPSVVVCTNLKYDHPDVYPNFDASKQAFKNFFLQIKKNGSLIINADNPHLVALSKEVKKAREDLKIISFSWSGPANYSFSNWQIKNGQSFAQINQKLENKENNCQLRLKVPGQFNLMNALAAIAALAELKVALPNICQKLSQFQSTKRRFELVYLKSNQLFFDDYAHHPSEISEIIRTLNQYFPEKKKLIAFQPHTYSRTKSMFKDFIDALGSNINNQDQLIILDIFASARESLDNSVSSQKLAQAISDKFPQVKVLYLPDTNHLAKYLKENQFDLTITLGAGDIYKVYQLLSFTQ